MKGSNPDSRTKKGKTCLHLATEEKFDDDDDRYFRNPVIIKLLLQYGANTELKDHNTGNTALHNALCSFSDTVINLLVDHGADCNALTRNGETVIQHAVTISARELFAYVDHEWMEEREARCKMVIALWEGGADGSIRYKNGDTLLHRLCSQKIIGFGFSQYFDKHDYNHLFNNSIHTETQVKNSHITDPTLKTKICSFFKQHNMLNAKNLAGDTPIFCTLNYMIKHENNCGPYDDKTKVDDSGELEILGTVQFLHKNGANLNVVNNHGYSPLLLAFLRSFPVVENYLVENGAVAKSSEQPTNIGMSLHMQTRSTRTKQTSQVFNTQNYRKTDERVAEILIDLFFGGESCEYLKTLKESKRGRFVPCHKRQKSGRIVFDTETWFELPLFCRHVWKQEMTDFKILLETVETYVKKDPICKKLCDIAFIEQAAEDYLKKTKLIEEDNCVICYSEKTSVTFFPCGHKALCSDCQKIDTQNHSRRTCAYCRQKVKFFKVDDTKPKKAAEVAEKITKMTLRKR